MKQLKKLIAWADNARRNPPSTPFMACRAYTVPLDDRPCHCPTYTFLMEQNRMMEQNRIDPQCSETENMKIFFYRVSELDRILKIIKCYDDLCRIGGYGDLVPTPQALDLFWQAIEIEAREFLPCTSTTPAI